MILTKICLKAIHYYLLCYSREESVDFCSYIFQELYVERGYTVKDFSKNHFFYFQRYIREKKLCLSLCNSYVVDPLGRQLIAVEDSKLLALEQHRQQGHPGSRKLFDLVSN